MAYEDLPLYKDTEFQKGLENLINKFSMENESNTPDFLLAKYLRNCLANYNEITKAREAWYGREPKPVPDNITISS